MTDINDVDPDIVAAAKQLADRAARDGITLAMLIQAATSRKRPGFEAALAYALEAGLIAGGNDDDGIGTAGEPVAPGR